MLKSIAVIPARYASTRLPGKPLADVCGKPLLQRVWESASRSSVLQRIIIATDDERIAELCFEMGAECVMTPPDLPSGTDRALSAYILAEEDADIVVNIQGDEPFLTGDTIDKLIHSFESSGADVGTIVKRIETIAELENPNAVKALVKEDNIALGFSRRAEKLLIDKSPEEIINRGLLKKHVGIYAYKIESLKLFSGSPQSESEITERLEQLRLLEKGAKYYCLETDANLIGVDTPEDLELVRRIIGKVQS